MKALRLIPVMALVFFGLLESAGVASAAPATASKTYNCTGGNVAAGTYKAIVITGVCYMPAGTVHVLGNLTVAQGALLDAVTPGDPPHRSLVPATVRVEGNVLIGAGAVLLLGCSPNIACPRAVTYDHIGGNLIAAGALGVVVHSTAIDGNLSVLGGGGGVAGGPQSGACFDTKDFPPPAPWSADRSLHGSPVYSDLEDSSIGGSVRVIGLQSCWLGVLRDQINGNASVVGNAMSDPDAMEINMNLIGGNMTCTQNLPAVQFGEGGTPNMLGGVGRGECAFNVLDLNPAPEAAPGGVSEHITVNIANLGKFSGSHIQTANIKSVTFGTTESGDTLIGQLNTDVFAGAGLGGSVQEQFLGTARPSGSVSFLAVDTCSCHFEGLHGHVTIRAYGTIAPGGFTHGTFLVTSAAGGLKTLAGYGTFTSAGQPQGTLHVVEHLGIA